MDIKEITLCQCLVFFQRDDKPMLFCPMRCLSFIYLLKFANCWLGHRNSTCRQLLRARNSFLPPPPPPQRLGSLIVGWATATARGAGYLEPVTVSSPHPPPPHKRDRPHHTLRTVRGFFRRLMSHRMGTALLMKNLQPGTLES